MPVPSTRPDHSAPLPRLLRIPRLAKLSSTRESSAVEARPGSPHRGIREVRETTGRGDKTSRVHHSAVGLAHPYHQLCESAAPGLRSVDTPFGHPTSFQLNLHPRSGLAVTPIAPSPHSIPPPARFALPAVSPRCKLRLVRSLEISPPDPPAFTGKTPPSSQGISWPIEVEGLLRGTGNPR